VITARTTSAAATRELATELAAFLQAGDLLVLAGDLGTGKTTFTQGLARGLGVTETVTSPAFVLARCYEGRIPLAHLDVYRLDTLQELTDLGIAEMLDAGGVTVVEWGDVVLPALPSDFLEIKLAGPGPDDDEDHRNIDLRAVGPSWPPRVGALRTALSRWEPPC